MRYTNRHFTYLLTYLLTYLHSFPNLLLCTNIKLGSRVRPPDAHNCFMFNARLLSNGHYHGNHITAATSGTRWDATTQVSSKSVHWWASYRISNIFQYGGRPPSWIFKIFIFGHVTTIHFQIYCSIPNFIKIGSRVRLPDAHNCFNVQCAVARQRPLPWQPHQGGHVWEMMACDHTSFVQIAPLVDEL